MADPFNPRLKIRSDYIAAIAVTLGPVVYFLPAILKGLVLCPDDGILQNVPFRVAAAQIIRSGNLPLWDPYIFGGMPLFGAAQVGILFPLNWFYLLFSAATASNLLVVSSYMAAALGTFFYARRTGSSIAGAAVTSMIWQAGGFLLNQISHINIVHTAALLPWVLWAMERYVANGSRARGAILATFVALQLFAGHQQTFAYTLLLVCAYALVMAVGKAPQSKRYLTSLGFAGFGVLLAAVQILPTWELLRNSVRSTATYDFFSSFSMPKAFVMTFLAPYVMGGGDGRLFRAPYIGQSFYPEYVPYAGVLAIMLAVVALLFKPDRRTKFWAVVVVFGLLLAFGRNAPLSLYRLVYYIPILNLFRVPARHLAEVHFAVAVLAGRGLTSLSALHGSKEAIRRTLIVAGGIFILTCLFVTWLRPSEFQLGRDAPVTVLRAPELFMPILIAAISAFALWTFTARRRGATALLMAVLAIDLALWGQFSGWYTSSWRTPKEYWGIPESVGLIREKAEQDPSSYRILTTHLPFDPSVSVSNAKPGWVLWTEPDIYMMHSIQNAAGYDGFGIQRYSELAGQMKLWGELTDPNATLRSNSRELDILNVRYVVARHERPLDKLERDSSVDEFTPAPVSAFPIAREKYGEFMFSQNDLSLPNISGSKRLRFRVPAVESDHVTLLTNLSFAEDVPDNTVIARLRLRATDGRTFEFPLRAGIDTADWAYDRADIRAHIRHSRPAIATSYDIRDAQYHYKGHTYVTSFALPEKVAIDSGELDPEPQTQWPGLLLTMFRISLVDASGNKTYPLTREMFAVETTSTSPGSTLPRPDKADRWKLLAQGLDVNIYENTRSLPRAWLASEMRVLDEPGILKVIRTGSLPDGSKWDPLRTVLVETEPPIPLKNRAQDGHVEVTSYQPNGVNLQTRASGDSMLVLSENDYPGWRVYVDDQPAPLVRVNYGLRGVVLPSGAHQVSFVYRPWSAMGGLLISFLTAVALVVYCRIGRGKLNVAREN